jgi:hypothetical protein
MTLRELMDAIAELHIVHGGDATVYSEDGLNVVGAEWDDDCVYLILKEEDDSQ